MGSDLKLFSLKNQQVLKLWVMRQCKMTKTAPAANIGNISTTSPNVLKYLTRKKGREVGRKRERERKAGRKIDPQVPETKKTLKTRVVIIQLPSQGPVGLGPKLQARRLVGMVGSGALALKGGW